jgi:deoxyguanosine kinase
MFKIISIEGNIASGKTTLLKNLKEYYKDNSSIVFLKEPVDEWEKITDENGNSMLQKFYANQDKYSFSFQMMAYISRLSIIRNAIKEKSKLGKPFVIITERCLLTDKYIFAKMLYDQKKIEEVNYKIYLNWFNEFANDFPINNIIYVNTDPEICYIRLHKRARQGEEIIPLSYLQSCHEYHEEYVNNSNNKKLLLDGNNDIYEDDNILINWINQIDNIITSYLSNDNIFQI